jgi:hypothetical protein
MTTGSNRLAGVSAVAIAAALVLTGCVAGPTDSGQPGDAPSTSTGSSSPPGAPTAAGEGSPAPTAAQDDDTAVTGDALSQAQTAAAQAAVDTVAMFARKDLPYDAWWQLLAPHLTEQAQQAYQYTDPANVPIHAITGSPAPLEETWTNNGRITVPTDAGTYEVRLFRQDTASSWLVWDIVPPDRQNG